MDGKRASAALLRLLGETNEAAAALRDDCGGAFVIGCWSQSIVVVFPVAASKEPSLDKEQELIVVVCVEADDDPSLYESVLYEVSCLVTSLS